MPAPALLWALAACYPFNSSPDPAADVSLKRITLSPYNQGKQQQPSPRTQEEKPSGGGFRLPEIVYLGPTLYPSIRFTDTGIPSRSGFGLDARFGLSTFLSGLVPFHAHIGVVWVEDKGDFDLTIIKLGTGVHFDVGRVFSFSASVGTTYLLGHVSGSRFTAYVEIMFRVQNLLFANSHFAVGILNLTNISADIAGNDLETVTGLMATVGISP